MKPYISALRIVIELFAKEIELTWFEAFAWGDAKDDCVASEDVPEREI
jgi:hypothetical protein